MNDTQVPVAGEVENPGWRRFLMPGLVLAFLGGHMLFIGVAISLAVGRGSIGVIPDYYQKGVEWDQHKAALAESDRLGWEVDILPAREISVRGERELVLEVRDVDGMPVIGAAVNLTMYHHALASDQVQVELVESDPGRYTARPKMRREGIWDFSIEAVRGEERFILVEKKYVLGSDIREATP